MYVQERGLKEPYYIHFGDKSLRYHGPRDLKFTHTVLHIGTPQIWLQAQWFNYPAYCDLCYLIMQGPK